MRIIGFDPGLRSTGWGIIEFHTTSLRHVAHGIIKVAVEENTAERLVNLYNGIMAVLTQYKPDVAAVEETFVNKNPLSSLKLGTARGIVLLAPAQQGLSVFEYAANQIKKAVVGVGHADKSQISTMIRYLLPTAGEVKLDAADALAVAICHAHLTATYHKIGYPHR